MTRYLVGYITETGTTEEAAGAIAEQLRTSGDQADVLPLDEIDTIEQYERIILGSPIHGMKVLPAFTEFLETHAADLEGRLYGLFILSYIYPLGGSFWKKIIRNGLRQLEERYHLSHTVIFGGKVEKPMPTVIRALFGIRGSKSLDSRDAQEIPRWVAGLKQT